MRTRRIVLSAGLVLLLLAGLGVQPGSAAPPVEPPPQQEVVLPPQEVTAPPQEVIPPQQGYLQRVGAWPYGNAEAVAFDAARDLALLGSGGVVLGLDVSDPLSPTLVSDAMHTLGYVEDLFYDPSAGLLYVAAGRGGMEIWDLQDPTAPVQLTVFELIYADVEVPVEGITVVGDMAYVATDWGYLHWVDISDPTQPVQQGFNGMIRPHDVFAHGGYVYAVGDEQSGFFPADFAVYGIEPDGSLDYLNGRSLGICGSAHVVGGYAYVGCGDLYIIDITDPLLPTVGSLSLDMYDVFAQGGYAYAATGNDGLQVVDVMTPSNPLVVGTYDSPGWARGVVASGDRAYLADGDGGLRTVDVLSPTNPFELGAYDTFGVTWVSHVEGDYAYVAASSDGLAILDVSSPMTPTLVGQYVHPGEGAVYDVDLQLPYAYLAAVDSGLRVVDVSDPLSPTEVGAYTTVDSWRIAVQGDYGYMVESVPNEPYWFHVLDISDPFSPTAVAALELPTLVWDIEVDGDYVYISSDVGGVQIFDVSSPANPVEVGVYPAPDAIDIAIQGDYAYIASADWDGGFLVVDVSDPANPVLVGSYNPDGWFHPWRVDVMGTYAYVTREYELYLFDVSSPSSPAPLDMGAVPLDLVGNLFAEGPYVYVSNFRAGLQIWENLLPLYEATLGPDSELEALPGTTVQHDFTLDNLGVTDRYTLTVGGNSWPATLLNASPITVPAGTAATLTVEVAVPYLPGQVMHGTDVFTLTAISFATPGMVLSTTGTTHAVTHPDLALTPPTAALTGSPGTVLTYTFWLTNGGDYSDTYALSLAGHAWHTVAPSDVGPLGPGEAAAVDVVVTIPEEPGGAYGPSAVVIASDRFTLTARSGWDAQVVAQATGTSHAAVQPGIALAPPSTVLTGTPGAVLTHTFHLTNGGDCSDTYALSLAGHAWHTVAPSDVGPLGPGEAAAVDVVVAIPEEPGGAYGPSAVVIASDRFTLTARSGWDAQVAAQASGTTRALVNPAVQWSDDQTGMGEPQMAVSYRFTLTNQGDYWDTFTLTVTGDWTATLSTGNAGPLMPGESLAVTLTVHVPADAAGGDQDVATLMARSFLEPGVAASVQATTEVAGWHSYLPVVYRQ